MMKARRSWFIVFLVISICLFVASAVNWIYNVTKHGGKGTLLATIPLAVAVFLLRFGYEWFYRNGFYTKKQASSFFLKCSELTPSGIVASKEEQYAIIYRDVVSDVPLRKELHALSHYRAIFKEGQKLNRR